MFNPRVLRAGFYSSRGFTASLNFALLCSCWLWLSQCSLFCWLFPNVLVRFDLLSVPITFLQRRKITALKAVPLLGYDILKATCFSNQKATLLLIVLPFFNSLCFLKKPFPSPSHCLAVEHSQGWLYQNSGPQTAWCELEECFFSLLVCNYEEHIYVFKAPFLLFSLKFSFTVYEDSGAFYCYN